MLITDIYLCCHVLISMIMSILQYVSMSMVEEDCQAMFAIYDCYLYNKLQIVLSFPRQEIELRKLRFCMWCDNMIGVMERSGNACTLWFVYVYKIKIVPQFPKQEIKSGSSSFADHVIILMGWWWSRGSTCHLISFAWYIKLHTRKEIKLDKCLHGYAVYRPTDAHTWY